MHTATSGPVTAITQPATVANQIGWRWVWALLVFVFAVLLIGQVSATPNKGFKDGAAVLTMVSLVAVGIERMIEMFWTLVATFKSGWWPLSAIADAVDTVVDDTNKTVQPVFDHVIAGLQAARTVLQDAEKDLTNIDAEIQKIRDQKTVYENQVKRILTLGKDRQRVQLIATTGFQAVNRLDTTYGRVMPGVRTAVNDANQVATGVSDILASFKDNPAKKLISLYLGCLLGLVVAGFIGLDIFAAAGASLTVGGWTFGSGQKVFVLLPYVGVAATGLILGFGANPTHQVVSYITEAAKARKAGNLAQPEVDDGSADGATSPAAAQQGRILNVMPAGNIRLPVAGEEGQRFVEIRGEHISSLLNDAPLELQFASPPPRARPASMNLARRR